MIKVEKYDNDDGTQIVLKFENGNNIIINYCYTQGLCFTPENDGKKNTHIFEISKKEDCELYSIFYALYSKIIKYKPIDEVDKKFKKEDKNRKHPLVKDDIIEWISEDDIEERASRMLIYLQHDLIHIFFIDGINLEGDKTDSVIIKTSYSKYDNFNIPFMDLYKKICETDFEEKHKKSDAYLLSLKNKNK